MEIRALGAAVRCSTEFMKAIVSASCREQDSCAFAQSVCAFVVLRETWASCSATEAEEVLMNDDCAHTMMLLRRRRSDPLLFIPG